MSRMEWLRGNMESKSSINVQDALHRVIEMVHRNRIEMDL